MSISRVQIRFVDALYIEIHEQILFYNIILFSVYYICYD